MEAKKITAVYLSELYYGDVISGSLDAASLKTKLSAMSKVENVHQQTFAYEEEEPTITNYKNQLTGKIYRSDREGGELRMVFTIGEYDYATKEALQGGELIKQSTNTIGWKRGDKSETIYKSIVGKTTDGVYVVFPKAQVMAYGANTDNAIGLSVKAVAMEAGAGLSSEYWFDGTAVDTPVA